MKNLTLCVLAMLALMCISAQGKENTSVVVSIVDPCPLVPMACGVTQTGVMVQWNASALGSDTQVNVTASDGEVFSVDASAEPNPDGWAFVFIACAVEGRTFTAVVEAIE